MILNIFNIYIDLFFIASINSNKFGFSLYYIKI